MTETSFLRRLACVLGLIGLVSSTSEAVYPFRTESTMIYNQKDLKSEKLPLVTVAIESPSVADSKADKKILMRFLNFRDDKNRSNTIVSDSISAEILARLGRSLKLADHEDPRYVFVAVDPNRVAGWSGSDAAKALRNLIATFSHRANVKILRDVAVYHGVAAKDLPSYVSQGFLKRITDPKYLPSQAGLFFDFIYRQTAERLGYSKKAWSSPANEIRSLVMSRLAMAEKNQSLPLVLRQLINSPVQLVHYFKKQHPNDPLLQRLVLHLPKLPDGRIVFRSVTNDMDLHEAASGAVGALQAAVKYGAYDHDRLVTALSGLDTDAVRDLREMIMENEPILFRYHYAEPDAPSSEKNYFIDEFDDAMMTADGSVYGFLSEKTQGRKPIVLPKRSVVMHRMSQDAYAIVGEHNPGLVNSVIQDFMSQKYAEYQFWNHFAPGSMAKTRKLSEFTGVAGIKNVGAWKRKLDRAFPNGWVLKPVWGFATEDKIITDKLDMQAEINAYKKSDFDKFKKQQELIYENYGYEAVMGELREHPNFFGWRLSEIFKNGNPHEFIVQTKVPIKKEYRVEVWGGKVLKGTTIDRYVYRAFYENDGKIPKGNVSEIRQVEQFAQKLVDALPENLRETPFAMDVALLKTGGAVLIESNAGGNSAYINDMEEVDTGIYKIGEFLEGYPAGVRSGKYKGGLTERQQHKFVRQMFLGKWGLKPGLDFKGIRIHKSGPIAWNDNDARPLVPAEFQIRPSALCAGLLLGN